MQSRLDRTSSAGSANKQSRGSLVNTAQSVVSKQVKKGSLVKQNIVHSKRKVRFSSVKDTKVAKELKASQASQATLSSQVTQAKQETNAEVLVSPQKAKLSFAKQICRCFKRIFLLFLFFCAVVCAGLYYLLFTLDGAKQALNIAQNFIPSSIFVDTTIVDGSFYEGLTLGNTLVDVQDIVSVTANDLTLKYDLSQILERKITITLLKSNNLRVALNDKLFESNPDKEESDPNEPPFRLHFPLDLNLAHFEVNSFSLDSQIVKVDLGTLQLSASAQAESIIVHDAKTKHIYVELLDAALNANEKAQSQALDKAESALAYSINSEVKTVDPNNLQEAINDVVTASQEGKSVALKVVKSSPKSNTKFNAFADGKKDDPRLDAFSYVSPYTVSSQIDTNAEALIFEESLGIIEVKHQLRPNYATYTDPKAYAEAIEEALLNVKETPSFVKQELAIYLPSNQDCIIDPNDAQALKEKLTLCFNTPVRRVKPNAPVLTKQNADAYEKEILKALASASPQDKTSTDTSHDFASVLEEDLSLVQATVSQEKANTNSLQTASTSKSTESAKKSEAIGQEDKTTKLATAKAKQQQEPSSVDAISRASPIDGVTAATASAIAKTVRETDTSKDQEILAKEAQAEKPRALVKEFGSGNGVIETLAEVILPFDIKINHFDAKEVRYRMPGFDTEELDLAVSAAWQNTLIKIDSLVVSHALGSVAASGSFNLDEYYDLDIDLAAYGDKNDTTRKLFEGVLYGLKGTFTVQGNLTDLYVSSKLNLGGETSLNVHANVLSAAMPMVVELKSRNFAYPIFDTPIVDLKHIDFRSIGNLADGVDVSLKAEVNGFDFSDINTKLKAQVTYDKAHIDYFNLVGFYKNESLKAAAQGDVFFGNVLGLDAKLQAKLNDASFLSPMLKGALELDADLVAVMDQSEQGKSAVAIASEPAYIEHRIPKTHIREQDVNPEALESALLASVKPVTVELTTTSNALEQSYMNEFTTAEAIVSAQNNSPLNKEQTNNFEQESSNEELHSYKDNSAALAKTNISNKDSLVLKDSKALDQTSQVKVVNPSLTIQKSDEAKRALPSEIAVVRPLSVNTSFAGGVPDSAAETLITKDQYVEALRKSNEQIIESEEAFAAVFKQSFPEIKANIRHVKAKLKLNGEPTQLNINNIVGDLQKGFRVELLHFEQGDGENILLAEGQITENGANLNAVFDLRDLSKLAPSVTGSFTGQMLTIGSLRDLNFELSGNAPRIKQGDIVLRKLVFNMSFNMQTRSINMTALADRVRFTKSMKANRQCFIDIAGTPIRHNITANCGGQASAYFSLDGSFDYFNQKYSANLLEMFLSTESAGTLALTTPVLAKVDLSQVQGSVSPIELKGEIGSINVDAVNFAPGFVKTRLTVSDLNLKSLSDFYPDTLIVSAPISIDADVLVERSLPDIKVNLNSQNGLVYSTVGAGIAYESFIFSSRIQSHLMHNTLEISLRKGKGTISSVIDIKEPGTKSLLDGYFKIKDFDLETISNIGQSFNELKGYLNANTSFKGDLSKPLVYGDIELKGSAVPRYDIGHINDFDIALNTFGQEGQLKGKVIVNGSPLLLSGNLNWAEGANGSLLAKASNMPIFLVGYGVARTDINTKVTLGEVLDIKGKVDINSANIAVKNVASSGVDASPDEILVPSTGTRTLMQQAPSNFKSSMDLSIGFGDDVHFEALGMVKGRLGGGLNIKKKVNNNNILGTGEINVVDGEADVYGRKFNFSQARILFFEDITDPNLNIAITADKEYLDKDVEVGIKVTGTAKAPSINLYSKPTMSQNEILSYIIYGHGLEQDKPLGQSTGSDPNMLLGLGITSASGLVSSLANTFGVRDFQVSTQGNGDQMQVAIQGYINRRLRVSYGYGVFTAISEFKVRYEIINQLYAEFVSSIDQAVDLIYTFEFD